MAIFGWTVECFTTRLSSLTKAFCQCLRSLLMPNYVSRIGICFNVHVQLVNALKNALHVYVLHVYTNSEK